MAQARAAVEPAPARHWHRASRRLCGPASRLDQITGDWLPL
jgi:hypothetical protein